MLQLGLIDIDYARGKRLTVTPYGMAVVKGEQTVQFSKYAPAGKESAKTSTRKSEPSRQQRLLQALKQTRTAISKRIGIPPYMVFSDATLADMARKEPADIVEFASVNGVGEKKLMRFGQEFIEAIRNF